MTGDDNEFELDYSQFTGPFTATLKINTAYNRPITRTVNVVREREYVTSAGACDATDEQMTEVLVDVNSMSDCADHCDAASLGEGCNSFQYNDGDCMLVTVRAAAVADEEALMATCSVLKHDNGEEILSLAVAFSEVADDDARTLYETAFFTKMYHIQESVFSLSSEKQEAFAECIAVDTPPTHSA